MDWNDHLKDQTGKIIALRKAQPALATGFSALHDGGMEAGALDVKTKELIALSIGISTRCLDCIGFHVKAAIRAGATRDEVAEAASVAVVMGGGPAMMYAAKALDAYDALST